MLDFQSKYQFSKIVLGMEATSIYSFHPAFFFKEDQELKALKLQVVVINPRSTKRYKDVFEDNKTDRIDAYYIADYLSIGRYSVGIVKQEEYQALQRLTRSRFEITKSLTRAKQHFLENLYYKVNKLATGALENSSVFSATMFDLITGELTIDELAQMPLKDLAELLNKKGHGKFAQPEKLAKALQKAIRGSYRLDKVLADSVDIVLSIYANEIRNYQGLIKQLDKSIEKVITILPESQILESIPGIGQVYSAGIIAEVGQIERSSDETKLAKYAGLAWRQHQSGNFKGDQTPMTHSGDNYLRYYLIEAAGSIIRYDDTMRTYYQKKYSEAIRSPRKRALALTARKLIRVIYTLLSRHQIYQKEELV
ncbi:IS110 family transposase [Lactiplantibacillus pentosus]|uniref:IS110 family transposase n=1 Tax=Lactiplantibacillus pentosus TaxID=1589 RepID=UPI003C1CBE2C